MNLVGLELDLGLWDEARRRGERLVAEADGPLLVLALDALAGVLVAQADRLALARVVAILEEEANGLAGNAAVYRAAQLARLSHRPEATLELLAGLVLPEAPAFEGLALAGRSLAAEIQNDADELERVARSWRDLGRHANAIRCLSLAGRLPDRAAAIAWAEERGLRPLADELRRG